MWRSRTSFGLGWALLPAVLAGATETAGPEAAPPNVVLIISDDQAWTDYGFMGHPVIKTPRLDRLASESAVFTRGYVTTSLCRPSLASIITGVYPHQHRITGNDPAVPPGKRGRGLRKDHEYLALCEQLIANIERVPTLPRLLAKKGYRSHQSGKWWEGHYSRGGFTAGMTHGDPARGGRHGDVGLDIGRRGMEPVLDFIDDSGGKPFFVWYAPFLPHTPHNPPERLLAKYRDATRPVRLARYYAMCEWFDETCGVLLDHLDRRGLRDNTLVVFVADNGWIQRTPETPVPKEWNQGFLPKSKQSPNEGGLRTPILLRWPKRVPPGRHEALASTIDLAPTVLAASGLPPAEAMPGINLLEVCNGKAPKRNALFGEVFAHDVPDSNDPSKSILYRWSIDGRWKLILTENGKLGRYRTLHPRLDRSPQLFDLAEDPAESSNLAAEHPEIVARMRGAIDSWWKPSPLR